MKATLFTIPESAWLLSTDADGLTYKKEIVHVGKFEKDDFEFSIDEKLLKHWKLTFDEMQKNEIEVPVPIEHTTDPEARRGTVVSLQVEKNSRGLPALFAHIKFRDEEAAKLAKTAQVSIFVPESFKDGEGNEYSQPIRHVALTDYPVIPKLDGFETIAASFACKRRKLMKLSELAAKLGLEVKEDMEDGEIGLAIIAQKDEIEKEKEDAEKEKEMAEEKVGEEEKKKEEIEASFAAYKKANPPKADPPVISASHIKLLRDNRDMKLSQLVQDGKISKAVLDELKGVFCGDASLKLSLSSEVETDEFDRVILALSKNVVAKTDEKTRAQTFALSEDNPLVKNAEARAKAAAG